MSILLSNNGVIKEVKTPVVRVSGVNKTITDGILGKSGTKHRFFGQAYPKRIYIVIYNILSFCTDNNGNLLDGNDTNLTPSTISNYGSISITKNSITITSNILNKGISVDFDICFFDEFNSFSSDVTFLSKYYKSYSFTVTSNISYSTSSSISWRGYNNIFKVNTNLSATSINHTINNSSPANHSAIGGIALTAGYGSVTYRVSWNSITINNKTYTPVIESVPSGWTVPTT